MDDGKPITSQIGMNYAGASKVIDVYWKELTRKGYTISEVLEKDWGDVEREAVAFKFSTMVIKVVLKEFEEKYTRLKWIRMRFQSMICSLFRPLFIEWKNGL